MTAQETYTAQAAAKHAAYQYNAQATEATRQYNARQADARREDARKQSQQRRTVTSSTVPAHWAETLILQTGYRAAAMANHPDRGGDHNRMVAINEAHSTLKTQGRI